MVSEVPALAKRLNGPGGAEVDSVRRSLEPRRGPRPWPPAVAGAVLCASWPSEPLRLMPALRSSVGALVLGGPATALLGSVGEKLLLAGPVFSAQARQSGF
jgi:hypothetical protein